MEFSASLRCIILLLLLLLFVFFRSKCAFSLLPYHKNLLVHVSLHIRIANHLVTDSCCRGGIVHSRRGCSRALLVGLKFKALAVSCKYFKQSK